MISKFLLFLKIAFFMIFLFQKYIFYTNFIGNPILNLQYRIFDEGRKDHHVNYNITFYYHEKVDPHPIPFCVFRTLKYIESKKYHYSLNKLLIMDNFKTIFPLVVLFYDFLILWSSFMNIISKKSLKISTLLLFHSLMILYMILYNQINIDENSYDELTSVYIRFLNLFIPAYYSESLREFIKASSEIIFSKGFLRLTLSILSFTLALKIFILNLFWEEGYKQIPNSAKRINKEIKQKN